MTKQHSKAQRRSTKTKICQERRIKVHQAFYDHPLKRGEHFFVKTSRPIPWINIKGFWLEQAGFNISTPIKIRVMDGCLVLTAEDK